MVFLAQLLFGTSPDISSGISAEGIFYYLQGASFGIPSRDSIGTPLVTFSRISSVIRSRNSTGILQDAHSKISEGFGISRRLSSIFHAEVSSEIFQEFNLGILIRRFFQKLLLRFFMNFPQVYK